MEKLHLHATGRGSAGHCASGQTDATAHLCTLVISNSDMPAPLIDVPCSHGITLQAQRCQCTAIVHSPPRVVPTLVAACAMQAARLSPSTSGMECRLPAAARCSCRGCRREADRADATSGELLYSCNRLLVCWLLADVLTSAGQPHMQAQACCFGVQCQGYMSRVEIITHHCHRR